MPTPESSSFLDLLGGFDPWPFAVMTIIAVVGLILHRRHGAPSQPSRPFDPWPHDDDDGLGHDSLDDLRRNYDPNDKWNRAPSNHDRL